MNKFDYKNLTPFKWFVLENFPFIEADFDALTDWQLYCKLGKEINKIIDSQNTVGSEMEKFSQAFIELKNYVDNYFKNLDVQDEINNKLNEMAQDGTLEEIINQKILGKLVSNVQFIMPKNFIDVESGNCFLVKAYGKNILFDTHRITAYSQIVQFLERNDVSHLDYVILSHYHDDHCGCFVSLINNGYIDKNTFVYIPAYYYLIEQSEQTLQYYNAVNGALVKNNIPYKVPKEGETLEIEDFICTFYNCETSIFESMQVTDYNDCSTVNLLEYGNEKILITGDITDKPFKRFVNRNMFNFQIDMYQIEHHGNNIDNQSNYFMQQIVPKIAIQPNTLLSSQSHGIRSSAISFLMNNNTPIYSQGINNQDVVFDIYKSYISLKQGKRNFAQSCGYLTNTFYVDSSSKNTVQNGTSDFPFVTLEQALSKIQKMPYSYNILNLADGEYDWYFHDYIGNAYIRIKGNTSDNTKVIIKQGLIFESSNVELNYLTFTSNKDTSIISKFSKIVISNCNFTSDTENQTEHTAIYSTMSDLIIRNSTMSLQNLCLSLHYDKLYVNNLITSNCNRVISSDRSYYTLKGVTKTNITLDDSYTNSVDLTYNTFNTKNVTLTTTESGVPEAGQEISLSSDITKCNVLGFSFGNVGEGTWHSDFVLCYNNATFALNQQFTVRTLNGTIKLKILSATKLQVIANTNNTFEIREIVGWLK